MKVLVITTVRFRQNGITSVIMNYYRNLDKNKIIMDFIGPNEIDISYHQEFKNNGSQYFRLSTRKRNILKYLKDLYNVMKDGHYDIVHVHGSSHLIAIELLVARIAKVKVRIAHSHNTKCEHYQLHKILTPVFNISYTHGIACSIEAGKWMFHDRKYIVLNNGIDIKKYIFNEDTRYTIRNSLSFGKNDIVIGNIAGFLPVKNHIFIINLMKDLVQIDNTIRCILIGDGSEFENIKDLISKYGLNNNVFLLGNLINCEKYYNAMDFFILPSFYEGLPVVLIEAQTNGVPIVISDTITRKADICEIINYFPLNDSKKWINFIVKSSKYDNKKRLEKSFTNSKKLTNAGYNVKNNAQLLYNFYLTAVGNEV